MKKGVFDSLRSLSWKNVIVLVLFFFLGVLLVWSIFMYVDASTLIRVDEIPAMVEVDFFWGFVPREYNDTSTLNFSRIVMDQTSNRNLTVTNAFDHDVLVRFKSDGNISELLYLSDNGFIVSPGSSKAVKVSVRAPHMEPDAEDIKSKSGFYRGNLYVYLYKR